MMNSRWKWSPTSERDFLWETYAADRRARLNLGIRRRLTPLLERDRRRIELMNCLLLSMPGTPVIYYGDEIGMGDNIHLGDRDGVRTPMQWSPDRNGGFSRADPARAGAAADHGPALRLSRRSMSRRRARDPHSLLNWMRRMLAVRRQHHAFGRGTLASCIRRTAKSSPICANMRRSKRSSASPTWRGRRRRSNSTCREFAGRVPVELNGGSAVPADRPAHLSADAAALWILLVRLAEEEADWPSWHTPAPEPMPEYQTFVLRGRLADRLHETGRSLPNARCCRPICRSAGGSRRRTRQLGGTGGLACRLPQCGERTMLLAESRPDTSPARRVGCCRSRCRGKRAGAAAAGPTRARPGASRPPESGF